ncbi:MAG: polysaccharide biosynthesis protein, partial [Rudaea sp.]
GQLLVLQLQTRLQGQAYDVVGLVDDDPRKRGMLIHNVPVYGGRQQIPELAATLHPDLIILAIPPRKVRNPRELLALCRATSAQIKIIPGLFDWLGHNSRAPGWEDINEEDLLLRSARRVDEAACRRLLLGRAVMVTGAAGSIGSELCRQIAAYQPERLILVDINESGLHDLVVELRPQAGRTRIDLVLGDISDRHKMQRVFESSRPQIVFHAAAYKHVPILEQFPQEGVRVNILGTRIIHSLAEIYGAERFVLISSDKAVNPSNVLGMTKWVGELIATYRRTNPVMLSTAVRFGNVLGSRGSVLPTFEKQIELGGPVTITHPDMTRYFLTISEAVSLVIQAAAMTRGGDLYALDMGVPVRIVDLAQRMIRAHGLRPGQDIAIEYTGMRPGEKLNEELIAPAEETCPTEHEAIFRIERRVPLALANLEQEIDQMVAFSANGSGPDTVRSALTNWISQLQSAASMPVGIPTVHA